MDDGAFEFNKIMYGMFLSYFCASKIYRKYVISGKIQIIMDRYGSINACRKQFIFFAKFQPFRMIILDYSLQIHRTPRIIYQIQYFFFVRQTKERKDAKTNFLNQCKNKLLACFFSEHRK